MTTATRSEVYTLSEGVRLFTSEAGELRFRKGIWSYTEAVINLRGQQPPVTTFFQKVARDFIEEGCVDTSRHISGELSVSVVHELREILDGLEQQGFLSRKGHGSPVASIISSIAGGNPLGYESNLLRVERAVFLSDSEYSYEVARGAAQQLDFPLDRLDPIIVETLASCSLTDTSDAVDHLRIVDTVSNTLSPYSCVIACFQSPNVSLLRNLNRVLVKLQRPLMLALLDGPFVCIVCTVSPQTGCFECFEQRMLSRLEDTLVYHQFVKSQHEQRANGSGPNKGNAPAVHMMVGALLSEGYLYSTSGMCRLAGRGVNIYLPLLEVQVEDLLRVPYCPACGHIAKLKMQEMYTSSREIVRDILNRVELV